MRDGHVDPLGALRASYAPVLDRMAHCLGDRLWITGGWARSAILERPYAGDVDCIVFASAGEIAAFARAAGLDVRTAPLGDPRIVLPDRNHIDIIPAAGSRDERAVLETIERFNFSLNSIAVNYATGSIVRTAHNVEDSRARLVRVNERFDYRCSDLILARNFEIFEKYHRLAPAETPRTRAAGALAESFSFGLAAATADEILDRRSQMILPALPSGARAWLVRGSVRSALLGEIRYWDDIDVVTDCSDEAIAAHLAASGMPYSPNFFGTPKITLHNGLKADIWGLRRADDIAGELARYAHNLDSIAWSVHERRLCDPLGTSRALDDRHLDLNTALREGGASYDVPYAALKSLYLIIRHGLSFSRSVSHLLNVRLVPSPFLVKHLIRLLQELCLCVPRVELERSLSALEDAAGAGDVVKLVRKYI